MTEAQKVGVVIIRLVACYIVLRGLMGAAGLLAFTRLAMTMGVAGMAVTSVLFTILGGVALFFAAPAISKLVTFDLS